VICNFYCWCILGFLQVRPCLQRFCCRSEMVLPESFEGRRFGWVLLWTSLISILLDSVLAINKIWIFEDRALSTEHLAEYASDPNCYLNGSMILWYDLWNWCINKADSARYFAHFFFILANYSFTLYHSLWSHCSWWWTIIEFAAINNVVTGDEHILHTFPTLNLFATVFTFENNLSRLYDITW